VVASAMVKGTSSIRASVCASSVLPLPVGPMSSTLLLASSTSLSATSTGARSLLEAAAPKTRL